MMYVKMLFRLVVLTVFLSGAVILNAVAEDNVLLDPGFEEGEIEWYNWNDGDSSGTITDEYSNSGNNSACREIYGIGRGCFGQAVEINPGELIEASVWVMNPSSEKLSGGAEVYLRIEFWDEEAPLGSGHIESVHVNGPTGEWIQLNVRGIAPAGTVEARVLAFNNGSDAVSEGRAYFDDFEARIE